MFCDQCGKDLGNTKAKFCKECGANLENEEATSSEISVKKPTASSKKNSNELHPWRRYFARMLDVWIVSISAGITLGIFAPVFLEETPEWVLAMIIMGIMLPYDTILLSNSKTTFGKWCLGISVIDVNGSPLSFEKAFKRSLLVLWRGLGLGIPFVALFTLIHQHGVLTKKGSTSWDEELGCKVRHENLQSLKVILAIGIGVIMIYLIALGSKA